jgi:hypothetical protein
MWKRPIMGAVSFSRRLLMRKWIRTVALAVFAAGALLAQDITGKAP